MAKRLDALIKPEMLIWARQYAYLSQEEAAKRLRIDIEKLMGWETGVEHPTVNQLHDIARVYRQSFAVFYLPEPPYPTSLPVKDFRTLPSSKEGGISYELASEIRSAVDRREIAVELMESLDETLPRFLTIIDMIESPAKVGELIRSLIFPDGVKKPTIKDRRIIFNFYRERLEDLGILVFQFSGIHTSEVRGFSLSEEIFPVVAINRKDSYNGRIFSLFHELTHILLRTSGVCDIDLDVGLQPGQQQVEIYCNQVAAEFLMPTTKFFESAKGYIQNRQSSTFSDLVIERLSDDYGVSKEAIVRKLLALGLVDQQFYQLKRKQYEYKPASTKRASGFVPTPVNVVSLSGKPFVRLVLGAVGENKITLNDASGYLGARITHFAQISEVAGV